MGQIRRIGFVLIIVLLVVGALAYAGSQHNREWIGVNLFTVSTKDKQAEFLRLAELHLSDQGVYADYLRQAEYMAEVILYLDGGEIAVAERFEEATRKHEELLVNQRPLPWESLAGARIENEKMFLFMVKNYQFNQADIKKHQNILEEHIQFVRRLMAGEANSKAETFLVEAKKYQTAGLNAESYGYVKKAKDALYSKISN